MVGSLALLMVMQPGSAPGREGHTETTDRTMAVESVGGVAALVGAGGSAEGAADGRVWAESGCACGEERDRSQRAGGLPASLWLRLPALLDGGEWGERTIRQPDPDAGGAEAAPEQPGAWISRAFKQGFRDAGGDEWTLTQFVSVIVPCESGWNPNAVSAGGHLGLAQFAPASWERVGSLTGWTDWTNPYQQGWNAAIWVKMTASIAEQWSCAP